MTIFSDLDGTQKLHKIGLTNPLSLPSSGDSFLLYLRNKSIPLKYTSSGILVLLCRTCHGEWWTKMTQIEWKLAKQAYNDSLGCCCIFFYFGQVGMGWGRRRTTTAHQQKGLFWQFSLHQHFCSRIKPTHCKNVSNCWNEGRSDAWCKAARAADSSVPATILGTDPLDQCHKWCLLPIKIKRYKEIQLYSLLRDLICFARDINGRCRLLSPFLSLVQLNIPLCPFDRSQNEN